MLPSLMINEALFQFKSASFNSINIKEIILYDAASFLKKKKKTFAFKTDTCNKKWCLLYIKILIQYP